ncbi:hypothetical protein [Flavobacterium aurantiibacter]|uniref:Uncharacterized protein n=1 Tax=Flavobacterium aurantiibacter TaxID=2023067 RepID=A0A256A927_9FLAO|nr:hypothetical protein [Flavobacterium aurantiibacter]OYQ49650.1 hypothetical protein CHX27_01340 [Flavobacterium aurantiibacter]
MVQSFYQNNRKHYDAAGERIVRYNTDQFEVSTNSSEVAQMTKDNIMIYPSGLLMGRVLRKTTQNQTRLFSLAYSKHYYIGSERITSRT